MSSVVLYVTGLTKADSKIRGRAHLFRRRPYERLHPSRVFSAPFDLSAKWLDRDAGAWKLNINCQELNGLLLLLLPTSFTKDYLYKKAAKTKYFLQFLFVLNYINVCILFKDSSYLKDIQGETITLST